MSFFTNKDATLKNCESQKCRFENVQYILVSWSGREGLVALTLPVDGSGKMVVAA